MRNRRCNSLLLVFLLPLASLCGCHAADASNGVVYGQVTFAGEPVSDGTIRFENNAGISLNVELDVEGKYQVQTYEGAGLPAGKYQVAILPRVMTSTSTEAPLVGPPTEYKPPEFPHIPPKFRDVSTSELTIQVARGENPPFNFDLSK